MTNPLPDLATLTPSAFERHLRDVLEAARNRGLQPLAAEIIHEQVLERLNGPQLGAIAADLDASNRLGGLA